MPAKGLNLVAEIDGQRLVLVTQSLAAVPAMMLRRRVASPAGRADEVARALDMLSQGF